MRWSYKTVHYELKKEGLLGSTFLDESEVELSLNEYGKSGWELVSLLETMDGLIAVFKQPLSRDSRDYFPQDVTNEGRKVPEDEQQITDPRLSTHEESSYDEEIVVEDFDVINDDQPRPEKVKKSPQADVDIDPDVDVGSIVIE